MRDMIRRPSLRAGAFVHIACIACVLRLVQSFSLPGRIPQQRPTGSTRCLEGRALRSVSVASKLRGPPAGCTSRHPFAAATSSSRTVCNAATAGAPVDGTPNLSPGWSLKAGGFVITPYGLLYLLGSIFWGTVVFPLIAITALIAWPFDRQLRLASAVGSSWGRLTMWSVGMNVKVLGRENLPPPEQKAVYLPNHTSYLDVPVSAFLPRSLKYLGKKELAWLPIIGWKSLVVGDILVDRNDFKSFRKLIEKTVRVLKKGNNLLAFPEGTRSKDGRLGQFKKGPFVMAEKAGLPVVPISIVGVAEVMPPMALGPFRKPKSVTLQIHPPIETVGKKTNDVVDKTRAAILSGLPEWQHA